MSSCFAKNFQIGRVAEAENKPMIAMEKFISLATCQEMRAAVEMESMLL